MLTSIIRTAVPYLVGLVVSLGVTLGVEVPTEAQTALASLLTFAIGLAYYVAVRWAAKRWPWLEVLLGSPKAPTYPTEK